MHQSLTLTLALSIGVTTGSLYHDALSVAVVRFLSYPLDLDQTNSLPHGIVRVAFVRRLSCYRYVIIELRPPFNPGSANPHTSLRVRFARKFRPSVFRQDGDLPFPQKSEPCIVQVSPAMLHWIAKTPSLGLRLPDVLWWLLYEHHKYHSCSSRKLHAVNLRLYVWLLVSGHVSHSMF